MNNINDILNKFPIITLNEMDSVKLMDRTDTKFIFKLSELPNILSQLNTNYKVLDINGSKISQYESLYFDTPNFELFRKHQCGKANRFKIRFRRYVESNLIFFEIKLKNNKGRTIKNRIKEKKIDGIIHEKANNLLQSNSPYNTEKLEAKLWVNYSRITLVNNNSPERVTIDLNLHFKNDTKIKHIDNLVIAEVKQDKAKSSEFMKVMKKQHIREGSISKYCLGVINLIEKIKYNNFKPKLITLNKTLYGTTTGA